jgi:hypothetical protein
MMPEDIHGDEIGAEEHPGKRRIQEHRRDPSGYVVGEIPEPVPRLISASLLRQAVYPVQAQMGSAA